MGRKVWILNDRRNKHEVPIGITYFKGGPTYTGTLTNDQALALAADLVARVRENQQEIDSLVQKAAGAA